MLSRPYTNKADSAPINPGDEVPGGTVVVATITPVANTKYEVTKAIDGGAPETVEVSATPNTYEITITGDTEIEVTGTAASADADLTKITYTVTGSDPVELTDASITTPTDIEVDDLPFGQTSTNVTFEYSDAATIKVYAGDPAAGGFEVPANGDGSYNLMVGAGVARTYTIVVTAENTTDTTSYTLTLAAIAAQTGTLLEAVDGDQVAVDAAATPKTVKFLADLQGYVTVENFGDFVKAAAANNLAKIEISNGTDVVTTGEIPATGWKVIVTPQSGAAVEYNISFDKA